MVLVVLKLVLLVSLGTTSTRKNWIFACCSRDSIVVVVLVVLPAVLLFAAVVVVG